MKLQFKDAVYYGEVLNNKMHGVGKLYFNNGNVYVGQFCNGKFHGYGEYYMEKEGYYYRGSWQNGVKQGKGFMKFQNIYYVGDFANDKQHGSGYTKLEDGTHIFGSCYDGMPYGDNTYYYPNGASVWMHIATPGGKAEYRLTSEYNNSTLTMLINRAYKEVNEFNRAAFDYTQDRLLKLFPKKESSNTQSANSSQKTHDTQPTQNTCNTTIEQAKPTTNSPQTENKAKITTVNSQQKSNISETTEQKNSEQLKIEQQQEQFLDLIDKANAEYNNENYEKSLKYVEEALRFATTNAERDFCNTAILICKAIVAKNNEQFYKALEYFKEARNTDDNDLKKEIDKQISSIYEFLDLIELQKEFDEAYSVLQDEDYENAKAMFKSILSKTNDREFVSACKQNIEYCEECIKEHNRVDEINSLYEKACDFYNSNDYQLAMQYFERAKNWSNDYEFQRQCEQAIKYCEDGIAGQIEDKAIDYFNDGVYYYNEGNYEKAKWNFQDAYETSNNPKLREECCEAIDLCNEYQK